MNLTQFNDLERNSLSVINSEFDHALSIKNTSLNNAVLTLCTYEFEKSKICELKRYKTILKSSRKELETQQFINNSGLLQSSLKKRMEKLDTKLQNSINNIEQMTIPAIQFDLQNLVKEYGEKYGEVEVLSAKLSIAEKTAKGSQKKFSKLSKKRVAESDILSDPSIKSIKSELSSKKKDLKNCYSKIEKLKNELEKMNVSVKSGSKQWSSQEIQAMTEAINGIFKMLLNSNGGIRNE